MQPTLDSKLLNGVLHTACRLFCRGSLVRLSKSLQNMLGIKEMWIMEFACFMGFMNRGYISKRGYIKAAYIFDFRKEIGKGHSSIDKNMNRTILK